MNKTTPEILEYDTQSGAPQRAPTSSMSARGAAERTVPPNSGIGICNSVEALAAINAPGNELVICQRSIPFCSAHWLEEIAPSRLPDFRILVSPGDVRQAIETQLDECGLPPGDKRDFFVSDIARLVAVFARITRRDLVDVRLDRIDHDACWKFHRDNVETRLLTTYLGPGTEWVDPQDAARALQAQKDYAGPLARLRLNEVAIFRGSRTKSGDGIVHRSPPIAGTDCTRLLLCLNTPSITSPEPWREGA